VRGRGSVDMSALEAILVRFSRLVVEQPWIKEIDINPLLATPELFLALDARIVLHDLATPEALLPRPAIRPYPVQYASSWNLKNGVQVLIRPIRPEDEPAMITFHASLSEHSVYLRYFHMEKLPDRVAHERLLQKCFIDYDREIALVAVRPEAGEQEILGIGRLTKNPGSHDAEVAVLITDKYQRQGLGMELTRRLIQIARHEKLETIEANILPENTAMRGIALGLGFKSEPGLSQTRAFLHL
jgi:acetyltransferase